MLQAQKNQEYEFKRISGQMPMHHDFVNDVCRLTNRAFGSEVPRIEVFEKLSQSNLGNFVFDQAGQMVAFALNELFEYDGKKVNYFSGAVTYPQIRNKIAIIKMLASLQLQHDEDILLGRTQNPIAMSYFIWTCEMARLTFYGPDDRAPHYLANLMFSKFGHRNRYCPRIYGRCLTYKPIEPETELTQNLMANLDVNAGDAIILVGCK